MGVLRVMDHLHLVVSNDTRTTCGNQRRNVLPQAYALGAWSEHYALSIRSLQALCNAPLVRSYTVAVEGCGRMQQLALLRTGAHTTGSGPVKFHRGVRESK